MGSSLLLHSLSHLLPLGIRIDYPGLCRNSVGRADAMVTPAGCLTNFTNTFQQERSIEERDSSRQFSTRLGSASRDTLKANVQLLCMKEANQAGYG